MNKKDLKAVLLASALGSAAFVAPVMAEENSQDPVVRMIKQHKLYLQMKVQ